MVLKKKINPFLPFLSAGLLNHFGRKTIKPAMDDFKKAEFCASTQRLGITFSEKVRDIFRFKWIRNK